MADAIISIVMDQLSIIIKDQAQELRAALGVEKEIKHLQSKLNKIRAVLDDAERRSFKEKGVKLWVEEIQDLCYDVEDVLDEWSTRTRRQQMEVAAAPASGSCSSFLPSCFHFKRIVMYRDIAKKIKELDSRLDRITKEKDQFKFDHAASVERTQTKRVSSVSFVDESEIQGRESDASALISKLLEINNNNGPPGPVVISIVGAGGIGKTTLAQLVYGDEQIKAHFDERVWVCVSDTFDEIKIAKAIVESTTKSSTNLFQLQMLLEKIQTTLSQKRLGSKKLKEIGQKIAQKCKGLPLAVTVMGSLLRYKHTEKEWQHVFDSKIWEMEEVETDLFPHLCLSYDDLTPQMKRCFSYCAVFPKDYEIHVEDLIRIWMAQGYLTTKNERSDQNQMELKGWDVFRNLAMRSFFQDLKKHGRDSNIIIYCKMHDIVHDFAEFITKNECYSISLHEDEVQLENHRHLSWQKTGKPLDPASICDVVGKLRSFFAKYLSQEQLTPNMFNALKSVRVLGLYGCKLPELPKEIGNLIHLRYINLKRSKVKELPDSICSLDNLQTLNLERCECLSRLPERIGNLCHLNKIDLSYTIVEELPDSICSLDNLQTLNLRGCGCLSRLPQRIGNLRHLIKIDLNRSKVEELPDSICSLDNLQILDLHRCERLSRLPGGIGNLRHLRKIDLRWTKVEELPDSICSLDNFEILDLQGCDCLSRLPEGIGNLRHLRKIDLSRSKIEELPDSICYLDNLQILDLHRCERLSRLPEGIGNLRHLSKTDLRWSKVEELPDSIRSLDNLQTLYLH